MIHCIILDITTILLSPFIAANDSQRYGYIKDEKYADAIKVLIPQLAIDQRSRAALSLLGYCHYMLSEFAQACEMWAPLARARRLFRL